jgi:tetratricopeptide repeat protein 8
MNTFALAMSRFRRRKFDDCISLCDEMLLKNPKDQAVWLLKCQSLTKKNYIDDIEMDEETIGDLMLDEEHTTNLARPGTSFNRPNTKSGSSHNPIARPRTKTGRMTSGMQRTGSRMGTGQAGNRVATALRSSRAGTSRMVTAGGRVARLGTANLMQGGTEFLDSGKINMKSVAQKKIMARPLFDYLFYVERNVLKALELAAECTAEEKYEDWWWKERLGKCYYQLGHYRDAEKQFMSSLKLQETTNGYLQLSNVYIKLDQPNNTIETLKNALTTFPIEPVFHIGIKFFYPKIKF